MGQDTVDVLDRRAGLSPDEVDALLDRGAAFVDADPELKLRRPYLDDPEVVRLLGRRALDAGR